MANMPFRPKDGLYLKDDFLVNEAVADATVGELDWELVTIGNASTYAYLVTTNTVPGRYGILRLTTAATADGDGAAARLDEDTIVLNENRGYCSASFRYPTTNNQLAGNDFRFGLQDSVTATESTVGIWVFSDAGVLSLQADSADHGDESVAAAGVGTLTSGTTCVLGTWHDVEFMFEGENAQGGPASAMFTVDGEIAGRLKGVIDIDDDEEMEFGFTHYQNSGGALATYLDIDYIDLLIQRGKY